MSTRSIYLFGVGIGCFASCIVTGFESGALLAWTAIVGVALFLNIAIETWIAD